jgi:LPS export ABC transporter protein LptC
MNRRTRNLLLFVLLSGAAFGTWMLARDPEPVAATRAQTAPPPGGFFLVDAELYGTGDNGRIQFTVKAKHVEQDEHGGQLRFEEISVTHESEANVNWRFSAAHGTASEALTGLRLTDDVQVIYSGEDDGELRIFETDWLVFDAENSRVYTEAAVEVRKGASIESSTIIGSGTGLDANLKTDQHTCCAQGGSRNAR